MYPPPNLWIAFPWAVYSVGAFILLSNQEPYPVQTPNTSDILEFFMAFNDNHGADGGHNFTILFKVTWAT